MSSVKKSDCRVGSLCMQERGLGQELKFLGVYDRRSVYTVLIHGQKFSSEASSCIKPRSN